MRTSIPNTLHNLPVLSVAESCEQGFASITVGINAVTEKRILANVAQHRDPRRACFIRIGDDLYELAIKREDVSRIEE